MAYVTVDDLKEFIGITGSGMDSVLRSMIDLAQGVVENYTGSIFEAVNETRVFDWQNTKLLFLDRPLHALTSVVNGGETWDSEDVRTMPRNGPPYFWLEATIEGGRVWELGDYGGEDAIQVTGTWGWLTASGETPPAISEATKMLAAFYFERRQNEGVSRLSVGDTGLTYTDGIPTHIREILDGYRFPHFGRL